MKHTQQFATKLLNIIAPVIELKTLLKYLFKSISSKSNNKPFKMLKQKSWSIIHYSILDNHLEIRIEMEYLVLDLDLDIVVDWTLEVDRSQLTATSRPQPPPPSCATAHIGHPWGPGPPNRHHLYTTLLCA